MRNLLILLTLALSLSRGIWAEPHHKDKHHGGEHHKHKGHKHHDFSDAELWIERFEDPARDKWQKPDLVVEMLGLQPGMNVADIGAASGYFTRRMASKILPGGFALAVDIEKNFFDYVTERAHKEGQHNLFTVECTEDDPRLPDATMDLVLIVDTLHHIQNRPSYYQKLKKSLRKDGRVVIVDFKKYAEIPVGPKPEERLKATRVQKEFEEAGFQVTVDQTSLEFQYILTAQP